MARMNVLRDFGKRIFTPKRKIEHLNRMHCKLKQKKIRAPRIKFSKENVERRRKKYDALKPIRIL